MVIIPAVGIMKIQVELIRNQYFLIWILNFS
jgi:hypothetical protein